MLFFLLFFLIHSVQTELKKRHKKNLKLRPSLWKPSISARKHDCKLRRKPFFFSFFYCTNASNSNVNSKCWRAGFISARKLEANCFHLHRAMRWVTALGNDTYTVLQCPRPPGSLAQDPPWHCLQACCVTLTGNPPHRGSWLVLLNSRHKTVWIFALAKH